MIAALASTSGRIGVGRWPLRQLFGGIGLDPDLPNDLDFVVKSVRNTRRLATITAVDCCSWRRKMVQTQSFQMPAATEMIRTRMIASMKMLRLKVRPSPSFWTSLSRALRRRTIGIVITAKVLAKHSHGPLGAITKAVCDCVSRDSEDYEFQLRLRGSIVWVAFGYASLGTLRVRGVSNLIPIRSVGLPSGQTMTYPNTMRMHIGTQITKTMRHHVFIGRRSSKGLKKNRNENLTAETDSHSRKSQGKSISS